MKNNIGELLRKRAEISAHKEAFFDTHTRQRFTFNQLDRRCDQVANLLLKLAIKPGDRVALLLKNGIEFIECYFAIARVGAALVPVNVRLTFSEIEFIVNDSECQLLVFDSEFDDVAERLKKTKSTQLTTYLRISRQSDQATTRFPNYHHLTNNSSTTEVTPKAFDDSLLFIMYTSGTTGTPKGVMHSHNTMLWAQLTTITTSDIQINDRYLLPLPMFHVSCLVPVSNLVHRGATGVIIRDIDCLDIARIIGREKITLSMMVPALLQDLLAAIKQQARDFTALRAIITGASPVPLSLIYAYRNTGILIYQAYGLTESCGPGTLLDPQDAEQKPGSCGKAMMHTDVNVITDSGEAIVPGSNQPGEIVIKAKHIMQGYWNNQHATEQVLKNGWLFTGDLATIDDEGFIYICDRKNDVLISGGENIYSAEVEKVINDFPGVLEVAVIGTPSEKWGETPLAIVVAHPGCLPNIEQLKTHCQQRLANYKVPVLFKFVDSLPRNASGKLQKARLRKKYANTKPV